MWIFTPTAFVSIVAHRSKPGILLVRARLKGDLERMFPGCKVTETRNADYRFRTELSRGRVIDQVAEQLETMRYDNVKGAIPTGTGQVHRDRAHAMHDVWGVMHKAQTDQLRPRAVNWTPDESKPW